MGCLQHISFPENYHDDSIFGGSLVRRVLSQIVETQERAIVQSVIEFARQEGVTDLFLLDAEFVKTAFPRWRRLPCPSLPRLTFVRLF